MSSKWDEQFYQELCREVPGKNGVRQKEPMKNHTTFRAGGTADFYVCPENSRQLAAVIRLCRKENFPWYILGNGSNLLVSDEGFAGVIIAMDEGFSSVRTEGNRIIAGAGALLSQIARKAYEAGLTGLEFAAGIPGSLGGAAVMNAGAYGSEVKDVLAWVKVLGSDGQEKIRQAEELELGYRTSNLQRNGDIVLKAAFVLNEGNPEEIRRRMEELAACRREKQPLEYPSAGSTFKRPEGYFAGKLIQDAGLKGKRIGGAQVSEKHSGFIINRDNASAQDIWDLCRFTAAQVKEKFGVELEMEVKTLGNFL